MSRKMVKLIHADNFFPNNEANNLKEMAENIGFVETARGLEVNNFNLIFPDIEQILYLVLGERVAVDLKNSGIIRKPINNLIHFETFKSSEEWVFIVALEPTTINFWYHIDPNGYLGDIAAPNSKDVFEGYDFDYKNLFEWKIHTNILLDTNQCLFFRPWIFHSLEDGCIQYYKLLADNRVRILVMGLPESCKSSIAIKLQAKFEDCMLINSIEERIKAKDLDFTIDGQLRHCYRLLNIARNSTSLVTIINMTCPIPKMRQILNCDVVVWANDKQHTNYQELKSMFIPPVYHDIECLDDSDLTISNILKRIISKKL